MNKLAVILLSIVTATNTARADCEQKIAARLQKQERHDQGAKTAMKAGEYALGAAIVVAYIPFVNAYAIPVAATGLGTVLGASLVHALTVGGANKAIKLGLLIAYAKGYGIAPNGSSQTPRQAFDELKVKIQSKNPWVNEDQIRNALILGDQNESFCPANRMLKLSKVATRVVSIINEDQQNNPAEVESLTETDSE